MVCINRNISLKLVFLDINWNRLDIDIPDAETYYNKGEKPVKPECFNEMIKICRKLSKPFPAIRVDLYSVKSRPILGEMTFTSLGGLIKNINKETLKKMGDWVDLPDKYIEK